MFIRGFFSSFATTLKYISLLPRVKPYMDSVNAEYKNKGSPEKNGNVKPCVAHHGRRNAVPVEMDASQKTKSSKT